MKAYVLRSEPNGNVLELREKPQPQPGPSQLLVKVRAASLNRGELIRGHGLIKPGTEKPAGMDAAGEVVGTGERVMGRLPGAFAEYGAMDKQDAIPIPSTLSWEEAGRYPADLILWADNPASLSLKALNDIATWRRLPASLRPPSCGRKGGRIRGTSRSASWPGH